MAKNKFSLLTNKHAPDGTCVSQARLDFGKELVKKGDVEYDF